MSHIRPRRYRLLVRGAAVLCALGAMAPLTAAQTRTSTVTLRPGMVITRSVKVARRTYRFAAPASMDSAVITVRGNDVTVDFDGATLEGSGPSADPDLASGVAIRIEGGSGVRLRNARIRGYKVAVLARDTHSLELANIDASYNWKPRLFSLVEHESLTDWLSFHHNEQDEWLRFGAAFYLSSVHGGTVRGNTVRQGMNGLLLVRSDSIRVIDNDFSFNSGLGIGLYRASDNVIAHNRVDFNVRGYSHGFYRRGQDSADILLYEQSMRNLVAFNSATHGGDGLFLWAGQTTMDTGEGGANDNLFYANDFSFAPANGMEATFSRNSFIRNRAEGNDYGLWGGYSFGSEISDNCFVRNRVGIAIEHGQNNVILRNRFLRDSLAIRLWADSIEPSDWGYPKHRDTRSHGYQIRGNTFASNHVRVQSANTHESVVAQNDSSNDMLAGADSACLTSDPSSVGSRDTGPTAVPYRALASLSPSQRMISTSALTRRDRSVMIVDDWGPYDWRSPKIWPVDSTHSKPLRLAVLGPPGRWRLASQRGLATVSDSSGSVGDTITVTVRDGASMDWELRLEFRGGAVVSPRGERSASGRPYSFGYSVFEPLASWRARFVAWSDSTDPRTHTDAFSALFKAPPLLERNAARLDYEWYRPLIRDLPLAHWGLEATTTAELPPGSYTLRTISDDGIRVWVDERLVIDNWSLHGSEVNHAALEGGRHRFRVQFFQIDGWTELRLDVLRGVVRSSGSPGPH